uniref:apolipoprotein D-like n=1 Tax=Doryrhamphus excisus TaxID=161450 RepID=UPI0025ADC861|nr:apolipoprotein D-like [Doryrhamphus excisus]
MAAMQVIALTLLSILSANAQVTMPGRCPRPAVQDDFDITRYLGRWYGIQRLPHSFQSSQCSTATYTLRSPGVVGVLNRGLLADGTITSITGSATAKDPSEPAKLQVSFYEDTPPAPYWVLASDYDNYALVYSCKELDLVHKDSVWIMSRRPTLAGETLEQLHSTLTSIGVRVDKLLSTNQDATYCKAMNQ